MSNAEKKYLDRVAQLGCVVCRNAGYGPTPAVIHHIKEGTGIGQRACDFLVIPLCPVHHTEGGIGVAYHRGPRRFEALYGSELDLLAQTIKEVFLAYQRCQD